MATIILPSQNKIVTNCTLQLRWYGTPVDMNVDKKNTIMKILSLFQNFQISLYLTKNKFLKIEKGKNYKSPSRIQTHN